MALMTSCTFPLAKKQYIVSVGLYIPNKVGLNEYNVWVIKKTEEQCDPGLCDFVLMF